MSPAIDSEIMGNEAQSVLPIFSPLLARHICAANTENDPTRIDCQMPNDESRRTSHRNRKPIASDAKLCGDIYSTTATSFEQKCSLHSGAFDNIEASHCTVANFRTLNWIIWGFIFIYYYIYYPRASSRLRIHSIPQFLSPDWTVHFNGVKWKPMAPPNKRIFATILMKPERNSGLVPIVENKKNPHKWFIYSEKFVAININ